MKDKDTSEFSPRPKERQFGDARRPPGPLREAIPRDREQPAWDDSKPQARDYQMGEPMKPQQQE